MCKPTKSEEEPEPVVFERDKKRNRRTRGSRIKGELWSVSGDNSLDVIRQELKMSYRETIRNMAYD